MSAPYSYAEQVSDRGNTYFAIYRERPQRVELATTTSEQWAKEIVDRLNADEAQQ